MPRYDPDELPQVLSANLAANWSSDIGFEIELDLLASQLPMRP